MGMGMGMGSTVFRVPTPNPNFEPATYDSKRTRLGVDDELRAAIKQVCVCVSVGFPR